MAEYPADLEFDVVLKDGATARLRPVLPTDADALDRLFHRLSARAVYQRFFRAKTQLSPEELEYFTNVDYAERMAFVVTHEEDIIGIGRYDRTGADSQVAEVAFAVDDEHQGRGIGTQLLQHLTFYARTQGITGFSAFVLPDNYPMMRVFRNSGFKLERQIEHGVYLVEFPTEETTESLEAEEGREQLAVAASLLPIFYPRSIAVIGASRDGASIPGRLFHNLLEENFAGALFPVNPSAAVVNAVRAYPSVLDIPDPVDLAFIVVPKQHVLATVAECAEKGVRAVIVISAGFSEIGGEGEELEAELLQLVRTTGMRMVGPNCMGILNTDLAVRLNGTFAPVYPPAGNVAMSSQSGALGIAILDYAHDLNIGISTFVSVGNKADISGNDLLLYWENDPATDVILLYLESFGNPRRFARIARRIARKKPIVAVKSGRTAAGTRAASSHTGALASLDIAVDALFHQAGVIRTDDLDELFDVTALLADQPVPEGRRVAVLTNAGGPGILLADALESAGLTLPEFSPTLQGKLQGHLNAEASVRNPVDMVASASAVEYTASLAELMTSDEVDAVVVVHIPAAPTGTAEIAGAIRAASIVDAGRKTLLSVFMRSQGPPPELYSDQHRVPSYRFPEAAARALARAATYGEWLKMPVGSVPELEGVDADAARRIVDEFLAGAGPEGGWLPPDAVEAVLRSHGLSLPRSRVASTPDEAVAMAAELGGPVALKVISDSALHKSDVGGVALDLQGEAEVRRAYEAVTSAVDDAGGALVQEFIGGGHEVIIGMTEDPSFGPLILFGLGGVFVELIGDVSFRIHPLTDVDAEEMVGEVKASKLLDGYRGEPPGDVAALEQAILRISALVEALPEMVEMDLNPVKVMLPGDGVRAVDARIRVRPVSASFIPSRDDIPAAEHLRS